MVDGVTVVKVLIWTIITTGFSFYFYLEARDYQKLADAVKHGDNDDDY